MAYVYMPLFFSLIGFFVVFIAISPYVNTISSIFGLLSGNTSEPSISTGEPVFVTPGEEGSEGPAAINYSDITKPQLGERYAQIHCDRIRLHENIYMGDDTEQLDIGVGQYAGSAIFGFGRPILLAGHHSTAFAPLEHIQIGDVLTVNTTYGVYTYEVYDTKVSDAKDNEAYGLNGTEEILTMYTCYPFQPLTSYSQRLFVYARKLSGPELIY